MSVNADIVSLLGGDAARVYPIGRVPQSPTYPYRVVGYAPNAPTVRTADGDGNPVRRLTVQHFSRTADGLEAVADDTFDALDGLAIYGDLCTQELATPPTRDADDNGVLSTTHTYRF